MPTGAFRFLTDGLVKIKVYIIIIIIVFVFIINIYCCCTFIEGRGKSNCDQVQVSGENNITEMYKIERCIHARSSLHYDYTYQIATL